MNIYTLQRLCSLKKTPKDNMSISWALLRSSPVVLRKVIETRRKMFAIARTQIQHHRKLREYRKCTGRAFETRSKEIFLSKLKEVKSNISRKRKKLLQHIFNYPSMRKHMELSDVVYATDATAGFQNIEKYIGLEDRIHMLRERNRNTFLVDIDYMDHKPMHILPALTIANLSFGISDHSDYKEISTDVLFLNVMENARQACSRRVFDDFKTIGQLKFSSVDQLLGEYEQATRQRSGNRSQNLQFGSYVLQLAHFVMLEKNGSRESRMQLDKRPFYREHLDLLTSLIGHLTGYYLNTPNPRVAQLPCSITKHLTKRHHISSTLVTVANLLNFGHLMLAVKR